MNVLSLLPTFLQSRINQSLTLKTLAWLGVPVVGVSSVLIALFYQHSLQQAESDLRRSLIQYIEVSSQRDSEIFQLAQANHTIVKQHLQERLADLPSSQDLARDVSIFDRTIVRWSDGTYRNFPQDQSFKTFPARQQPTVFIGPQVSLTPELKQQVLLFQDFATRYGRAFYSRYTNTWINSSQNISADYRPDSLWGLEAQASTNILDEEYGIIATPKSNPDRQSRWTRLYFDPVPQRWMVSLVTPVDNAQGKHVATIGNDIILNDLMAYTVRDTFPHGYNLIFRADGQLIVHPDRMGEIQEKQGKLKLQDTQDPHLQQIFQQAQHLQNPVEIGRDNDGKSLWAITKLRGPDWYFVTVYPTDELKIAALLDVAPLLIFAAIALLTELFFLYQILRRHLHQPLSRLLAATEAVAQGEFGVTLDDERTDELGRLARSFTSMAEQLKASFHQLSLQNGHLEAQVQIRTHELEATLTDLKLTQAQLIQSEKLSSLGQMVAGIAHEVNNPIGFVDGNLKHANLYMRQLLEHIQIYQAQKLTSEIVTEHAEAIDLSFIQDDFPKLLNSMQMGTDRIREIVISLRNFSRLDETQLKNADLHDGIDSTLLILHHRLKQSSSQQPIQLEKHYGTLPEVQCYPGLLNQVFMNIVSNAIDALEHTQDPKIMIHTSMSDQNVIIKIQDNGPGISQEAQHSIFDPFFTTKEVGKGTGLGLSISYQIITEKHRGKIICESSPHQGTTFTLTLPQQV